MEMLAFYAPAEGPIIWNWLLFAVGVAGITYGAGRLTDSAVAVARKLNVPKIIIGGTIVSLLTTVPEFAVSFSAAIKGYSDTAFGNAIGSAICNIGLILGVCAIVGTVAIKRKIFLQQGAIMLAAGVTIAVVAWTGSLGRLGAGILLGGLAGYIYWSFKAAGAERLSVVSDHAGESPADATSKSIAAHIAALVLGGLLVTAGATLLVDNAIPIAKSLGIPELVIALTLVALGTSLPELATAIASFVKGHGDLSIGNIIGANVLNIFWVLGGVGMVREIEIRPQTMTLDMPVMLGLMLLLLVLGALGKRISKLGGGVLLAVYVAYLAILFTSFGAFR